MKNKNILRFICDFILILSILFGYWWLTWILAIIFLFYFNFYIEIAICGVIYDSLYGIPLEEFWNMKYIFTLSSIVLFLISLIIKKRLIVYES